jgi:membrane protein
MRRVGIVLRRTAVAFYDDQMTHHAAALTYYALMSLFPALLLGTSLLGILGQYPETYDAVLTYLDDVVPEETLNAIDRSLEAALRARGTATTTLILSVAVAFYGITGALEAARRALNVVFEVERGRRFLRRKAVDIASGIGLIGLVLVALILVFVGERLAIEVLGESGGALWATLRWPAAFIVTGFLFSSVYYVTPDVHHRGWRWITPGAVTAVICWLAISWAFGRWIESVANVAAIYGAFASAIVLIAWIWLTNVCVLFGAELNAEIERENQLSEGVPRRATLGLRARTGRRRDTG